MFGSTLERPPHFSKIVRLGVAAMCCMVLDLSEDVEVILKGIYAALALPNELYYNKEWKKCRTIWERILTNSLGIEENK